MLWKHPRPTGTPIVQPALTPDGDVLDILPVRNGEEMVAFRVPRAGG